MIAVVPFASEDIDPDVHDLARWLTSEAAAWLARATEVRQLVDEVEIRAESLGAAAAQLQADAALGATVQLAEEQVQLEALLADADGNEKGAWSESLPLGAAPRLGPMLARAVLLALGDDSLAAPENVEPVAPGQWVLRLARASANVDTGELLSLIEEQPAFAAPRRALLEAARAAAGSEQMPVFLTALERLVELRPDDAEALLELADYRLLHFDEEAARGLLLQARDKAEQPPVGARACMRLAALAEQGGRIDEAIAHLNAATRLDDDPAAYLKVGALLLPRDADAGIQALTRAAVLAPQDPEVLLHLARALREHGGHPSRAMAAAAEAARQAEKRPDLAGEIAAELEQLLGEDR